MSYLKPEIVLGWDAEEYEYKGMLPNGWTAIVGLFEDGATIAIRKAKFDISAEGYYNTVSHAVRGLNRFLAAWGQDCVVRLGKRGAR